MILTAITLILFSFAEGSSTIGYVVPEEPKLDLPLCQHELCETLDQYAANESLMIMDQHTLIFLPGYHILDTDMVIANRSGLTLRAKTTPSSHGEVVITCVEEVGMTFTNVQELTLQGLEFRHCGSPHGYPYRATLYFDHVSDLSLASIRVSKSSGYGLVVKNAQGYSYVYDCTFQKNLGSSYYNGGNALLEYYNCSHNLWAVFSISSSNFSYGNYTGYNYSYYNSTLATGLTVILSCTNITMLLNNVTMENNFNNYIKGIGGNMFIHFYNESNFISNRVWISGSRFNGGGAKLGAGMAVTFLTYSNKSLPCQNTLTITNSEFSYNSGVSGCGLYIEFLVPEIYKSCPMGFITIENTSILYNKAKIMYFSYQWNIGVAIYILNGYVKDSLRGSDPYNLHLNNITVQGSIINQLNETETANTVSAAIVSAKYAGNLTISDSHILDSKVTGISLFKSKLSFSGTVTIRNNSGINGGGLVLCGSSFIQLHPNAELRFISNKADIFGGAIYSESQCKDSHPICFFQFEVVPGCASGVKPSEIVECYNAHITMDNNTAGIAGYDLYGGNVANCYFHKTGINYRTNPDIFYRIFNVRKNIGRVFSAVSSDPIRICSCSKEPFQHNCSEGPIHYSSPVYPGQEIHIPVVIVGQLNGTVPGSVLINGNKPYSVIYTDKCTRVPIKVKYNESSYELKVLNTRVPKGKKIRFPLNDNVFKIIVKIKDCPIGFILDDDMCSCDSRTHSTSCNITNSTITRDYGSWVGFLEASKYKRQIIYHYFCPFDYCIGDINIRVGEAGIDSDAQCSPHRTGLLCGACETNFSVSFGSTSCLDCTGIPKAYPFLISMVVAVCVLLLFALLIFFEISVTDGLLSGLLFYANVIYSNRALFRFTATNFFTIAISVINFGIPFNSCFYDGMDAYSKMWYKLCVPTLLWLVIVLLILLSARFGRVAKLIGNNSAKILATLIELTFNRVLQACILVFSFSDIKLTTADGSIKMKYVWLPDANVDYLKGKHCGLFVVATLLSLFLLAYTLMLLFVQLLMKYSHLRCFRWVNRLKPILDAYTAPHIIRPHCRFWGGYLLLARIVLFIYIAVNVQNRQDTDFNAIIFICVMVLAVPFMIGGVYKSIWLNLLNGSFFLNLIVLCIYLNHLYHRNKSFYFGYAHSKGPYAVYPSSGIAIFITFVIILYYIWKKLRKCPLKACKKIFATRIQHSEGRSLMEYSQQQRSLAFSAHHDED